jgi:hypothetical protein
VKCRYLGIAAIALATLPATIWAQDISGEWTGQIVTNRGIINAIFDFSVDGSKLKGSAIGGEEERPLFEGKIKGNRLSFVLRKYSGENYISYNYEGKISGNTIDFSLSWGSGRYTEFIATRVKRRQ